MDFAKSLMVLLRRWYIALPALVIALGLAAMVYESVPAKYESRGTVLLLASNTGATAGGPTKSLTNPLLAIDGSLTLTSTAIIQVLLSPEVTEDLYKQGATASFEVGDGKLGGPFINVVATGSSAAEAQRTVGMVLQRASVELRQREIQYKAPAGTFIQIDDLVRPTEAKRLLGSKIRAAGAALALAMVFSLSSAFMIESIMENRRDKRSKRPAEGSAAGGGRPVRGDRRDGEDDGGGLDVIDDAPETTPIYGLGRNTRVADLIGGEGARDARGQAGRLADEAERIRVRG